MSDSRRAALEAAFDKAENEEVETEEVETPEVPDEQVESPEVQSDDTVSETGENDAAEDVAGKPGKKPAKDSQQVEQEAAARKPAAKPGAKPAVAQKPAEGSAPGADVAQVKPPQSWTPAEREHWAKIPAEAQKAIQRRELETSRVLNESAQSRRFQNEFVNVVKPFAHLIRARNSTPLQSVKNLMETAAGLTTGNGQQKAMIVAEIIDNYGVDVKVLDDVLSKRPASPTNGQAAIPPQLASVLQPIHDFMGRVESGREQYIQQLQTSAAQTIEEAEAKLPFFEDLREEIADFLEIAAARGRELTVEKAHEMAVNSRPDIKKILDQRARAATLKSDPAKIAAKKKAAKTIHGAPRGEGGGDGKGKSRRSVLSDAWDDAS